MAHEYEGNMVNEFTSELENTTEVSESIETAGYLPKAQKALIRMRKAYEKGSGCTLSWDELEEFNRSIIGEWWGLPVDVGR